MYKNSKTVSMNRSHLLHLLYYLMFIQITICYSDDLVSTGNTAEEFIPTSDWQEVKEGQAIPAGLHVRMDMGKGGRWAKLMDEKESDSKAIIVSSNSENSGNDDAKNGVGDKTPKLKIDEIKSALKNIKEEKIQESSANQEEDVKNNFRSMDEIKSAFDELNLSQQTDFEVMTKLLTKFKGTDISKEEKVFALQDLEYYVHQVDNAIDFVKIDGIMTMVKAINSSSDSPIILEAAHVIGSAVQNNPAVKVKAIEAGALPALIRLITDTRQSTEVRRKALYAISSLIRHFPAAQYYFKTYGGFTALKTCFNEHGTDRLRMKALSLITDLVVERQEVHQDDDGQQKDEKVRQYKLFSLELVFEDMDFCHDITDMLNAQAHDQREVLVNVMKNLRGICKISLDYLLKARSSLLDYEIQYKELLEIEESYGETDSFFHQLHKNVVELSNLIAEDLRLMPRIEL